MPSTPREVRELSRISPDSVQPAVALRNELQARVASAECSKMGPEDREPTECALTFRRSALQNWLPSGSSSLALELTGWGNVLCSRDEIEEALRHLLPTVSVTVGITHLDNAQILVTDFCKDPEETRALAETLGDDPYVSKAGREQLFDHDRMP